MNSRFQKLAPLEKAAVYTHVVIGIGNQERTSFAAMGIEQKTHYMTSATEAIAANPDAVKQLVMTYKTLLESEGIDCTGDFLHTQRRIDAMTGCGRLFGLHAFR